MKRIKHTFIGYTAVEGGIWRLKTAAEYITYFPSDTAPNPDKSVFLQGWNLENICAVISTAGDVFDFVSNTWRTEASKYSQLIIKAEDIPIHNDQYDNAYVDKILAKEKTNSNESNQNAGLKHDLGKPPFDLISPIALTYLSQVLAFGAKKYHAHNWRKGIPLSKLISACYRHLAAIQAGIDYDSETGLPHAAHLMCEVMFILEQLDADRGPRNDDRFQYSNREKNLLVALLAGDVKEVSKQINTFNSI